VVAPAASAFAGQQGWLRTQVSTALPASGSEPAPCASSCAADALDPTVDHVEATLPAGTAWRWQTTFTAPSAGSWQLKIFVANQSSAQLFMDGLAAANRVVNMGVFGVGGGGFGTSALPSWHGLTQTQKSHDPSSPRLQQAGFTATFAQGETHTLDLRAYGGATDPLRVRFVWVPPDWPARSIDAAVAAARAARAVVIFAYDEGTEGADRGGNDRAAGLRLPGYQDDLISAVAAANRDVVVVLNTGDPVLMPWVTDVRAVLEMWYPGQRGGAATANILLGGVSPSGKLPVTFPDDPGVMPTASPGCVPSAITANPPSDGNCPLYPGVFLPGFVSGNHSYKTIGYLTNGIFQGHRWYDLHQVEPLFPFGHGLSYTRFAYSNLSVESAHGGLEVSFLVRNVGGQEGAEVPQVYLGPPDAAPSEAQFAVHKLVGFERIRLRPGQAARVAIPVDARELSYWSISWHAWVVPGGRRTVYIGASSRDIRLLRRVDVR
jgi:beta-glucosidase